MRRALFFLSLLAEILGIAAIAFSWLTNAPHLGYRIAAAVLLMDQAMLAVLYLKLPLVMAGIPLALRAGSILAIVLGVVVVAAFALVPGRGMEIAMPAVGVMMIAHAFVTLRVLSSASPTETA